MCVCLCKLETYPDSKMDKQSKEEEPVEMNEDEPGAPPVDNKHQAGDDAKQNKLVGKAKCTVCLDWVYLDKPGTFAYGGGGAKKHLLCKRCVDVIPELVKHPTGCRMHLKSCKGKPAVGVAWDPFKQGDAFYCLECLIQTSNGDQLAIAALKDIFAAPQDVEVKQMAVKEVPKDEDLAKITQSLRRRMQASGTSDQQVFRVVVRLNLGRDATETVEQLREAGLAGALFVSDKEDVHGTARVSTILCLVKLSCVIGIDEWPE